MIDKEVFFMKKTVKAVLIVMLCLLTAALQSLNTAYAVSKADPTKNAALTLLCPYNNTKIDVYYVADLEVNGTFTVENVFQKYNVIIGNDGWKDLAETLALYAKRDKIPPTKFANSYTNGSIRFDGLECGLYLVTFDPIITSSEMIITQPIMVSLPTFDEKTQQWLYDVVAKPKSMRRSIFTGVDIEVIKNWIDEGKEGYRPHEIEVELLRNGDVYETVILNEENNWRYAWYGLDGSYDWSVIEKTVPDNYTVTVVTESQNVIITNTVSEDAPPKTPTPSGFETPSPSETPVPSTQPSQPGQPGVPTTPPPKLPQTGQLWWPVGLLTSCGLIMFFLGLLKKRNDEK